MKFLSSVRASADATRVIDLPTNRARIGLGLVLSTAILIAATVWLLPADHDNQLLACAVAVSMTLSALFWRGVGGLSDDMRLALGYPIILIVGLASLGVIGSDVSSSYTGLLTLAFIYVGLLAPPGSTLPLIIPAIVSWLLANGVLDDASWRSLAVRLPVVVVIWCCIGGFLSQHSQATDRNAAVLRRQALRDHLTGLRNRRVLDDLLLEASSGDAIAILDIDRFKAINDEYGHATGDQILTNFARSLTRNVRDQDLVVRFGGDEFLIFLPRTDVRAVDAVLRRIREDWQVHHASIGFSGGVATVRVGHDGDDAFGEADRMLYEAKAAGRNQWVLAGDARPNPQVVGL
jgi:diguanylate cyclase (GGDEF)-like protein